MKRFFANFKAPGKKGSSILWQFTFSYFILLLIPIIMGMVYYWYIIQLTTEQTVYSNMLILKNSMNTIENTLNAIENYSRAINQLTLMDEIVNNSDIKNIDLLDVQDTIDEIPLFEDDNQMVESIYLYSYQNQIMLGRHQAFLNLELYYYNYFKFGNMSYEDWKGQILENPQNITGVVPLSYFTGSPDDTRLLYLYPYFDKDNAKLLSGQILYIINDQQIKQTLSPAFQLGAGYMYILDRNNHFLITMEQEGWQSGVIEPSRFESLEGTFQDVVDGEKMVISYCKSAVYGWTYVIAIPKAALASDAQKSLNVILFSTILLAVGGIIMILLSYTYNRRPLMNIIYKMGSSSINSRQYIRNGLWLLAGSVSALIKNNSALEGKLQEQQRRLRESFFIQIVSGEMINEENLLKNAREYEIESDGKCFRGVYMEIVSDGDGINAVNNEYLTEFLVKRKSSSSQYAIPCFWPDENHVTLLYVEPRNARDPLYETMFKEIHFSIKENFNMETIFYVGSRCNALQSVHQSFTEARKMITIHKDAVTNIIFVNDHSQGKKSIDYSVHDEERLLEYVQTGKTNEVKRLLDGIYQKNFVDKHLSVYMRDLLFYRMVSTLVCSKWSRDITIHPLEPNSLTTEEFFCLLTRQYETLCEKSWTATQAKQQKMENDIIQFIDSNYADSALSLTTLSQQFGMTESYLSTLIKQLAGENFSTHLNKLRIARANTLLMNPKLSVAQIGYDVGYENATSFGRAYKRVMGYSPSQFRSKLTKNQKQHKYESGVNG